MFKKLIFLFTLLLLVGLVVACANEATEPKAAPDPAQPEAATGLSALIASLESAGATVEPAGEVEQPFFAVPGQLLRVNGNDLQVFEYADEAAAAADAALVAPGGGSVGPNMVSWLATPHFYRQANVIGIYVGDDGEFLALLTSVFGEQFAGG